MIDAPDYAPLCAAPDPSPRAPRANLPRGSCDTHMHICGPAATFDYSEDRIYTPPDALLPDYLRLCETLGIERIVFVQPSIYGTDNSAMLSAMRECPLANRGIAVVTSDVTDEELDELHSAGVRGLRFNLVDVADKKTELPLEPLHEMARRIKRLGWHLELLVHVDDYPRLDEMLGDLEVDIVVGHLGYFRPHRTVDDEGFRALLRLMQDGRCWTKLTGPYRISSGDLPYTGTSEFAQQLVQAAPERVIWGSDWPHVMVKKAMPNDGDLLDLLFDWVPDADLRHGILVTNPETLYEF